MQFTIKRITTTFCYWDGETAILFDVGTSDNVKHILRVLRKKLQIPLEKLIGVIPTHYHFDHGGGALELWRKMQPFNPEFKIFTTTDTITKLQDPATHLVGARTTFGEFVGSMIPLSDDEARRAFHLIPYNQSLPFTLPDGYEIRVIATPGHTHDHKSPVVYKRGEVEFLFAGEALGTYFADPNLHSLPSCMPPNFHFDTYMQSIQSILALNPQKIGFGHFGLLKGKENIQKYIELHKSYMIEMRDQILTAYHHDQSTRYILSFLREKDLGVSNRVGVYYEPYLASPFFENLFLAVSYAIMVDLGIKEPKYEQPVKLSDSLS